MTVEIKREWLSAGANATSLRDVEEAGLFDAVESILLAVAPLIAEECVRVAGDMADDWLRGWAASTNKDSVGTLRLEAFNRAGLDIAAAIRQRFASDVGAKGE